MSDPDLIEKDSTAFVLYVPPGTTDAGVESCVRLGAAPQDKNRIPQSTTDESNAYKHAVSASKALSQLSQHTYNPASGIALLTPGTINLVATQGVNTTAGSYTNSVNGPSYTVTQAGSEVISASYTSDSLKTWATCSYNQAATVSVSTVPLQASILFGPSYSATGPIVLSNNYGFMWSSTVGFAVTATLARTTSFGWHTIVTTDLDGSNQAYFTKEQGSTGAQGFSWTVPTKGKFDAYDTDQNLACKLIEAAAVVADAVAVAYALSGLDPGYRRDPSDVQTWLKGAEWVAIGCTALNGICLAVGIALGKWVDDQTKDGSASTVGATTMTMADGTIELATPKDDGSPGPDLKVDRATGVAITVPKIGAGDTITLTTGGATITLSGDDVTIKATTITLDGNLIRMNSAVYNAPTTPKSIGLSSDGNIPGDPVPVNWGAPNWPPD